MKKIFQIAESVSLESGGLRTVLVNLNNHIKTHTSVILTNNKEKEDVYLDFPSTKFNFWSYSDELTKYLSSNTSEIDILHLHGVFMHAHYTSSRIAQNNNIPYIVSPHGMLEPWHLKDKQLKKSVYLKLFLNSLLAKSKIIHAITPFEKENLYKLTGHKNIIEIPNFIHYSKLPNDLSYNPEEEYLLFLSRLHSKKGLDILIQSMSQIENKKIKLKIVGTENSYSNDLKKLSKKLGVEHRIDFLGSIYGNEKYNLFANAKAFVAPSYSEAIGMVNLEAAACKTPVITSFNTGISPEWNNNGGIMIKPSTEQLTSALNIAANWTVDERMQRGKQLSDFVMNNYSWEKKGYLWDELYNSI